MITEDYVYFEIAKLLKEKGFEGNINAYYHIWDNGSRVCSVQEFSHSEAPHLYIPAPTLQMAMKWLREVYHLHISIEMGLDADNCNYFYYLPTICKFSNRFGEYSTPFGEEEFNTYEEATEAAIKYCLENLV